MHLFIQAPFPSASSSGFTSHVSRDCFSSYVLSLALPSLICEDAAMLLLPHSYTP